MFSRMGMGLHCVTGLLKYEKVWLRSILMLLAHVHNVTLCHVETIR